MQYQAVLFFYRIKKLYLAWDLSALLLNGYFMLTLMNDLPDFVVGVRATGDVTKADLERVLIPALDKQVKQYDEIYYLLLLETDIKNWDLGAWVSDAKVGLKHLTRWTKIAVVSAQEGVQKFTDIFSKLSPGEARGYDLNELETAKAWISERTA